MFVDIVPKVEATLLLIPEIEQVSEISMYVDGSILPILKREISAPVSNNRVHLFSVNSKCSIMKLLKFEFNVKHCFAVHWTAEFEVVFGSDFLPQHSDELDAEGVLGFPHSIHGFVVDDYYYDKFVLGSHRE